jgi:hypothetical protein
MGIVLRSFFHEPSVAIYMPPVPNNTLEQIAGKAYGTSNQRGHIQGTFRDCIGHNSRNG